MNQYHTPAPTPRLAFRHMTTDDLDDPRSSTTRM
jgi:hypothetical protein